MTDRNGIKRVAALGWILLVSGALAAETPAPAEAPKPTVDAAKPAEAPTEDPSVIPPALQGPAVRAPREIFEMLEQRKRALQRREDALRTSEARLTTLKTEIQQILERYEAQVKAAQQEESKNTAASQKASLAQVAKMYETMPAEEAAARIEKMPNKMALQVLRMLKGQTAGNILALVSPDKAAKLTERFIDRP
jgi:flagellar motility protein MotE (MotC chaperone)